MKFSDSIALNTFGEKMAQNVVNQRIAHAQIFVGEDGSEALPAAIAYISFILCNDRNGLDACGTCASCQKMAKLVHPDVHWIFPASISDASGKPPKEKQMGDLQKVWRESVMQNPFLTYTDFLAHSGEEKKRLEINKYAAEYLFSKMSLKSYEGGMKIGVIWKPELMNVKAANTLLKVIEEPPPKSLFLLVSENSDAVLTTICSRTQITRLPKPGLEELGLWLQNKLSLNPQSAETISFAADRNVGKALAMAKEMGSENELFVIFRAWMRLCFSRDVQGLKQWVNENSKLSRDVLSGLLQYGLQIVFSALNVNLRQKDPTLINPGERDFIKKFAPFVTQDKGASYYKLFNDAISDVNWNGNAKIILSDLSFKFMMLLHQKKG